MSDFKALLKDLKKSVKEFKKISKNDDIKGIEKAKELIKKIDIIKSHGDFIPDEKNNKEILKVKSALKLYISNVENMVKFKKKWD